MAIDPNMGSAGQAGSPGNGPVPGQPTIEEVQRALETEREAKTNLEKKLGEQGSELGEFRSFFNNISPVLEKLDASPELVQAILDGKVTIGEAALITEAHDKVKKDMGKEEYTQASAEDIAKLVQAEVGKAEQKMDAKMAEMEELRVYEASINEFIARTPDFPEYAKEVDKWMDEHKDVLDVSVAYYAVKGQMSEAESRKRAEIDAAEYAKQNAGAAGGGSSRASYVPSDSNIVDELISGRSNPNVL